MKADAEEAKVDAEKAKAETWEAIHPNSQLLRDRTY